ncbi:MAG: DNA-protecting protein DprA, partial [Actinomycetota bacterium]|nr:DNA-protecting protein DprA [Actinomycetota bacterium]
QGAAPLLSVGDVLFALGLEDGVHVPTCPVSPEAASLLELLREGAQGADDLVARSGRASADVSAALVELELAGLATHADGVYRAAAGR